MKFSIATIMALAATASAVPTFLPIWGSFGGNGGYSTNTYCDTGYQQITVDQSLNNGLFGILSLPWTILGLVAQANNQIIQLSLSVVQQKQYFTQHVVACMKQQYPSHSIVVAPQGSYSYDSTPIQKTTVSCHTSSGYSQYDVLVFDHGNFNLHGAGGFQNWAYVPNQGCKCGGYSVSC